MNVTRRSALRLAVGAGASGVMAAFDGLARPVQALAIAGVDDAVVGGVLLVLMTLAGYAVSAEVSQATLSAMGYSFTDFCADTSNQSAAVARAIADANNLGVEVQRAQAESAAQAIAEGTGAVGEWFADVASTGKIALDGIVNGVGAVPAALWGLVAQWHDMALGVLPTVAGNATCTRNGNVTAASTGLKFRTMPLDALLDYLGNPTLSETPTWLMTRPINPSTGRAPNFWYGSGQIMQWTGNPNQWTVDGNSSNYYQCEYQGVPATLRESRLSGYMNYPTGWGIPIVSDNVFTGAPLPGVDVAPDAPETYGTGYDKTIIGADAVYGPDGEVVSAGTIALPADYPYVQLPYVDGLYGLGAGVVPGIMDVPISGATDVVVGTESGVVSMPISQAVVADTSITAAAEPSVPVVPPGTPDVGPWQPAYSLPFQNVWPFNMIYQYVSELSTLGGAS